jgi:predicted DNA-binding ribbon-helix-helix protein
MTPLKAASGVAPAPLLAIRAGFFICGAGRRRIVSIPGREGAALSSLTMRNVVVADRRTSARLEPVMWEALHEIAAARGHTIHELVTEIHRERATPGLTAAIRVFVVMYYRDAVARGDVDVNRRPELDPPIASPADVTGICRVAGGVGRPRSP